MGKMLYIVNTVRKIAFTVLLKAFLYLQKQFTQLRLIRMHDNFARPVYYKTEFRLVFVALGNQVGNLVN